MTLQLLWSHATTDVPAGGLSRQYEASETERSALANALGIREIGKLVADYTINSIAGGGWRLKGTVSAEVVQACVVSLESVPQSLVDDFDVEFWPHGKCDEFGEEKSVLQGPDVETLEGETIDVGRIVFETLSAGLDPYPRKSGVDFDWQDKAALRSQVGGPFAGLSRLKDRS